MSDNEPRRDQMRKRVQERRRRTGLVLLRAVDDASFRQELLSNSRSVFGVPVQPEGTELPPEVQQLRRELLQEVLDRAASDAGFRAQLGERPRQALQDGGFGPRLEQLRAEMPQPEVRGYGWGWNLTGGGGWGYFWDPGAPSWEWSW